MSAMTHVEMFHGMSAQGDALTAVYAAQPSTDIAFALIFANNDLPRFVHWGRPLTHPETVLDLYDALRPQRVSGALDDTAWPSILPTQAEAWSGAPRFEVRRDGMELFCKFEVTDITCAEGDVAATDDVITVTSEDSEQGVGFVWRLQVTDGGLLRQQATILNLAAGDLEIGKVELGFAIPEGMTEILTTTGHHLRERSPQRQPLTVGRFEKASLVGRPDFDASLLLNVGEPGFGFDHGDVYSVHIGWSGNSELSAERLPYTQGVIGGAEVLFGGEMTLRSFSGARASASADTNGCEPEHTTGYTTPWVYGAYGNGLNEVAQRFHAFVRSVHRAWHAEHNVPMRPRPVILNTWEAVYFEHNYDTLTALADKAVEMGVERFVVDDGWFGSRRDDTSGLGDWQIAQEVWPDGPKSLKALADYVHSKGMEFGLWFEPEMINPDSETFRKHPDWVLKPTANRLPMQGRSQQVLDLTNPEAFDYIYHAMDSLIDELGIDYIKWDHNKYVVEAVSPRSGKPAVHEQTLAVYRIFRDLREAHPMLEIESCSSGGGRIDLGILELASRVWGSDCVDPVERVDIQRYTSLLVPPEMIGEHVGASPAHSTHRATSLQMRLATAFFGHYGIEWNLLVEPQQDLDELHEWVSAFKEYRDLFASGIVQHCDSTDPSVCITGVVSQDQSHAIYRFTQLTTSQTYPAAPMRLVGLDANKVYRIKPMALNLAAGAPFSEIGNGQSVLGWWNENGVRMSGTALATYGLRPPVLHPANAVMFEVTEITEE